MRLIWSALASTKREICLPPLVYWIASVSTARLAPEHPMLQSKCRSGSSDGVRSHLITYQSRTLGISGMSLSDYIPPNCLKGSGEATTATIFCSCFDSYNPSNDYSPKCVRSYSLTIHFNFVRFESPTIPSKDKYEDASLRSRAIFRVVGSKMHFV